MRVRVSPFAPFILKLKIEVYKDMQVSVETISTAQSRMTIEVPKEYIEPKVKKHLKSLAKRTKINGFRPGKAPLGIIEQRYGSKIRQDVFNEVLKSSLDEAIAQEKLQVVGEPVLNKLNTDIEKIEHGLSYTVTLETYPKIATLNTDKLPVEKLIVEEITESDIDTMLEKLRQQRITWQVVERAAKIDDQVVINFIGTIDGKAFKDNKVKQISIVLGQNNVPLPGLEDQLLGASAGDKREFDIKFPLEHSSKEIAGKKVNFIVNVLKVSEPKLPELDVEFIKSLGVSDGSIDKLREDARQNMLEELDRGLKMHTKLQILDALLQANPIEAPQSLVNQEAEHLLKLRKQEFEVPSLNVNMFKEEATKRVKIGILVNELVRANNIQISQE
ncbi:MAG TPA: trigger factor, partial [Thioploca sp.]|nr:trigger factor [Thioploca sp.]